jgi:predicted peptidase
MKIRLIISVVAWTLCLAVAASAAARDTGFLNRTLKTGKGVFKYQVYVPAQWNKTKRWPIVLFLHGAGERGDDGMLQTEVGIGTAIRRFPGRFPCIVVFPQCRKDAWWSQPEMEEVALKSLDLATREFKGDPDRTYLTGISMGGYGSWDVAQKHPGKFAALGVVCGGIVPPLSIRSLFPPPPVDASGDPYLTAARKIGTVPVWIFHGGADPVVPTSESQKMEAAIKAVGGNVKYTEYPGVGHNSWDKAYSEPDFPVWLLSQQLGAAKKN